jgi:hypothetical protein
MPISFKGNTSYHLGSFTVATLPTVATFPTLAPGDIAWASNGRQGAQGAGAGTGVLVTWNGTDWRRVEDAAVVLA